MKNFITLTLICFSIVGFAQADKKVEKNDEKIDELNVRLDNLLGTSKSISGDSVEYKLDILFQEIQSMKSEMKSIRKSVEEIKTPGVQNTNNAGLDKFNSKIQDIESGEYYVVLASERSKARAESKMKQLSNTGKIQVVQNIKGTWFHVILENSFNMRSAIQKTTDVKKEKVKDAWWVTGKKLKGI